MRISKANKRLPVYLDGTFSIYEIVHDPASDYPATVLAMKKSGVSYMELQIFDSTKLNYKTSGISVTKKIRTRPMRILQTQYIEIDHVMYKVENAVTAPNSTGFKETDITLSNFTESFTRKEV